MEKISLFNWSYINSKPSCKYIVIQLIVIYRTNQILIMRYENENYKGHSGSGPADKEFWICHSILKCKKLRELKSEKSLLLMHPYNKWGHSTTCWPSKWWNC